MIAYVKALAHYKVFEHPAIGKDGESYWPEAWPIERLERRRTEIGSIIFELVYQGNGNRAIHIHQRIRHVAARFVQHVVDVQPRARHGG